MHRLFKQGVAIVSMMIASSAFAANFSQLQQDITANPNIHVGMQVVDPANNQSLYSYQADQYFHPASITKLFTAISAMLSLGGDYQFTTALAIQPQKFSKHTLNGNVYVKFSGDPSLTAKDLNNLLAGLQKAGINKINGNVILDNTVFPSGVYALGVAHETDMWSYGAPIDSIIVDENAFTLSFKTGTPLPVIATINPAFVKVHSDLVWENAENSQTCTLWTQSFDNTLNLEGCLPPQLTSLSLAIPNPIWYATTLIHNDLEALGINLSGKIVTGATPAKADFILVSHNSAPLSVLLTHALQVSDNLYASAITKTMGIKAYGLGTEKAGILAVSNTLAPYQLPNYYLENGSGTSDLNLVTPTVMTDLLYHANQNYKLASFLHTSLPVVGLPGAFGNFPSAVLKGKIIAKNGSLSNISTITGFMQTGTKHMVIFSLLIDDAPLSQSQFNLFEAKVLEDLYNSGV